MSSEIVVVRTRPSIGDALMLGPTILGLRKRHEAECVRVLTDAAYMYGALVDTFHMLEGVDSVHTDNIATTTCPRYDANDAFLYYEARHKGNPPLGIAEFWAQHFNVQVPTLRPQLKRHLYRAAPPEKPCVGIATSAGHRARRIDPQLAIMLEEKLKERGVSTLAIGPRQTSHFRDVPRELNKCSVIVTPDTSILHLAGALGIPTVSLWGVINPTKRVEDSRGSRIYQTTVLPEQPRGRCSDLLCPCCRIQQNYSCMRSFTVNEIYDAVLRNLD